MRKLSKGLIALMALTLALCLQTAALAYQPGTLHSGSRGEDVKTLQTALIQLGYLGGTPDGIFGTNTENAVKKFQKANKLTADGLAGAKTQEALFKKAAGTSTAKTSTTTSSTKTTTTTSSTSSSGLFGGDYATLRVGSTGTRVTALQKALISLGYLKDKADGKFGAKTQQAVIAFQKANKLTADGLAGKLTLTALEKGNNVSASAATTTASTTSSTTSTGGTPSSSKVASGPNGAQVKLLHWYNDVKPKLSNGQKIYIYEPASRLGWTLRIYSRGRHLDAEPLTAEDTATMLKAFGGVNTWSQKGVYVQLPDGTWTIGATHDNPHLSGSIKDNNFDGHLCVHFLRTMSECEQMDPNYGVSNQRTIRSFWKSITGETIVD